MKNYFVKGLHKDMQQALKSIENFATPDLKTLVEETGTSWGKFIHANEATV